MEIDNCLILSAGFGTRMGRVGKYLPKPLWKLGDSTYLKMQYDLVRKIGFENIHINISHQSIKIKKYLEEKGLKVISHYEDSPLEVGGTIQSLVNKGFSGSCLILNCDQLLHQGEKIINDLILAHDEKHLATLGSVEVDHNESYNRLKVFKGSIVGVSKFGEHAPSNNFTYSGVGIVNFSRINSEEFSTSRNFFKLLFKNSERNDIKMLKCKKSFFVDLGSKQKYLDFLFNSDYRDLRTELNLEKYYESGFFNFSGEQWRGAPPGSVIISGKQESFKRRSIYFDGIIDQY